MCVRCPACICNSAVHIRNSLPNCWGWVSRGREGFLANPPPAPRPPPPPTQAGPHWGFRRLAWHMALCNSPFPPGHRHATHPAIDNSIRTCTHTPTPSIHSHTLTHSLTPTLAPRPHTRTHRQEEARTQRANPQREGKRTRTDEMNLLGRNPASWMLDLTQYPS